MKTTPQASMPECKRRVIAKLEECLDLLEKKFGVRYPMPKIHWMAVKGTTGGKASPTTNEIFINFAIMSKFLDEYVTRTIPHELAHIVAFKKYGRGALVQSHGQFWRNIMYILDVHGADATRCHNYDVSKVTGGVLYRCKCITHNKRVLTLGEHSKVLAGAKPKCRKCNTALFRDPTELAGNKTKFVPLPLKNAKGQIVTR